MRRVGFGAGSVALALAISGCGGGVNLPTVTVAHVSRQAPAPGAPVADVAGALAALGYRLDTSAFPAGQNSVLSPLSIAYAFAMARAGAGGATADQLDRVLGFPATGLHDAFNAITRQVVTADVPPAKPRARKPDDPPRPPVICVGNALFPQQGYPIGQPFLRTLAAQYGTGVHPLDFTSPKAVGLINDWARQQTAGRIRKVFDQLDPATKLVIANAVYLRADWQVPFSESPVTDQPFTRADGQTTRVPTMQATSELRYAAGPDWQAVELPYAGGQLVMRILLPAKGTAPGRLLAPQTLAAAAAALRPTGVGLSLPRWNFGTTLDLVPALRRLGLTLPFSGSADFSGISPGLFIAEGIHEANISVDEWGTEAAAVTALGFATSGVGPPPVRMVVDRPFAFTIVHKATGVPLFVGQVADPLAHG